MWTNELRKSERWKRYNEMVPLVLDTVLQIGLDLGENYIEIDSIPAAYDAHILGAMEALNSDDPVAICAVMGNIAEMIAQYPYISQVSPAVLLVLIRHMDLLMQLNRYSQVAEIESLVPELLYGFEEILGKLLHSIINGDFLPDAVKLAVTDFLTEYTSF